MHSLKNLMQLKQLLSIAVFLSVLPGSAYGSTILDTLIVNYEGGHTYTALFDSTMFSDGPWDVASALTAEMFDTVPVTAGTSLHVTFGTTLNPELVILLAFASIEPNTWEITESQTWPGITNGVFAVSDVTFTYHHAPAPIIPEPATLFLFGLGLLGFAGVSRRKV